MIKQRVVFLVIYFATPLCFSCSNGMVFWFDVAEQLLLFVLEKEILQHFCVG